VSRTGDPADLRVRRTRQALREALVSLVEDQAYQAVTVTRICRHAMVNKATFYLHYQDKYDLLLDVVGERFGVLNVRNSPPPQDLETYSLAQPTTLVLELLQHVADHAGFYRGILGPCGSREIRADVQTYVQGLISQRIRAAVPDTAATPVPVDVVAAYTAAAGLGAIVWWLDAGTPSTPGQFAEWLLRLISLGTHQALGLPAPVPPEPVHPR
jgi:AcrR family transcriptional regulator